MSRVNIFQDNKFIRETIASTFGYPKEQKHSWFTKDIYFQTYFYLTKRFGFPEIVDDYKKISVWDFEVKDYTIRIEMNSSWVIFMMFGDSKYFNLATYPISWIKYNREADKKKHLMIINTEHPEKRSKYEKEKLTELFQEFQLEKGFSDDISNEEFNKNYALEFWSDRVDEFNKKILGINHSEITEKYGRDYSNSKTRHALKTLRQFLYNMQTPIWIRDVPFNIKGFMTDEDAFKYSRYENNISIKFKN